MSDFLWPHELQHTRILWPSISPWVSSNSCSLSWWHHPTISSSLPCSPQSFSASGSFSMCWFLISEVQNLETSASAPVLPMNIQSWFLLGLTGLILLSRESQESSPALQFKTISCSAFSFIYGPALTSVRDYWKNHSFDFIDLCWQSDVSNL